MASSKRSRGERDRESGLRKAARRPDANEIDSVRDPHLRIRLQEVVAQLRDSKGRIAKTTKRRSGRRACYIRRRKAPGREQGVRRVRIGKTKPGASTFAIAAPAPSTRLYCRGKTITSTSCRCATALGRVLPPTVFEVNQKGWRPRWEVGKLGGKLVMRLHKGDMIEVDDADGVRRIKTVHRLEIQPRRIRLVPHYEGGEVAKRRQG